MAKKVIAQIKLQIPAGQANPSPPIGPALGQHGVNIMEFCKSYNAKTAGQEGTIIPVLITVFADHQSRTSREPNCERTLDIPEEDGPPCRRPSQRPREAAAAVHLPFPPLASAALRRAIASLLFSVSLNASSICAYNLAAS